ncbi:MAG: hypothetical protein ACI9S9_003593 [Planctomycetota bacterium]|jgi:hypothetical protein
MLTTECDDLRIGDGRDQELRPGGSRLFGIIEGQDRASTNRQVESIVLGVRAQVGDVLEAIGRGHRHFDDSEATANGGVECRPDSGLVVSAKDRGAAVLSEGVENGGAGRGHGPAWFVVGRESMRQECCPVPIIERASTTREGYVAKVHDLRRWFSVTARAFVTVVACFASLAAQHMCIPMGDPVGLPATARQIERHGVTWAFADEHVIGTYANADPWVLGPVEVIRIDPATAATDGRVRHGSMRNPDPSTEVQGYDSELYGPDTLERYDPSLNVARGVSRVKLCHRERTNLLFVAQAPC